MKTRTLVVGTVVVGLSFIGCTTDRSPSSEESRQFVDFMRRTTYDYEPLDSPSALAKQAQAVVTGTIVDVKIGQSYSPVPDGKAETVTSVIEVKVDRVVTGDPALVFEGSIYIQVGHPAFVGTGVEDGTQVPFDLAAFAAIVPNAYGVFFVDDITAAPEYDTIIDEGSGRPAGAKLTDTYVQGFLIEDPDGTLVSVKEPFEVMPSDWQDLGSVEDVVTEIEPKAN